MNKFLLIPLIVCLASAISVQGDTDSEFSRAALDETPDRVKDLFEKGANINARDDDGDTALMNASNNGRYKTVKFLIENGADVNAKETQGKTPIMFAAALDYYSVIKLLVDNGANINATDNIGWSALIYAAYNGRERSVCILLRMGADADNALKYATEHRRDFLSGQYGRRNTNGNSGYQKAIETIRYSNIYTLMMTS